MHPNRSTLESSARLILLPGMGADARIFEPQGAAFPQITVPAWIEPHAHESLPDYAQRMGEALSTGPTNHPGEPPRGSLGRTEPVSRPWIGGVSFGGMVALEMARHLPVRGVILIASCRHGGHVPRPLHWLEMGSRFLPDSLVEFGRRRAPMLGPEFRKLSLERKRLLREMFLATPVSFLRWSSRAVMEWDAAPVLGVTVHHIHGAKDLVIPLSRVRPDEVIPDGGHLINMTHPEAVNRFIAQRIM